MNNAKYCLLFCIGIKKGQPIMIAQKMVIIYLVAIIPLALKSITKFQMVVTVPPAE